MRTATGSECLKTAVVVYVCCLDGGLYLVVVCGLGGLIFGYIWTAQRYPDGDLFCISTLSSQFVIFLFSYLLMYSTIPYTVIIYLYYQRSVELDACCVRET